MTSRVRRANPGDAAVVAAMRAALWPDAGTEELAVEAAAILAGSPPSTLPLVIFVAGLDRALVGFVEVGLRSHADGCDPRHAVGFIEGWYVAPEHRKKGIGRALIAAAEAWAREHGCIEMASDTWIDNPPSQHAHAALGFDVVDRVVNFRKSLQQT